MDNRGLPESLKTQLEVVVDGRGRGIFGFTHGNSTPGAAPSAFVRIIAITFSILIVGIVMKHFLTISRLVGLQEVRYFLVGFKKKPNKIRSEVRVAVMIVKGGSEPFVSNTGSTSCPLLVFW